MMCQVDNALRNLKALFAAGDPFAAEKATETWKKYELLFYFQKCILQQLT